MKNTTKPSLSPLSGGEFKSLLIRGETGGLKNLDSRVRGNDKRKSGDDNKEDGNDKLWDWLRDPNSLTARLKQASNNTLTVRVLTQDWLPPTVDEAAILQLQPCHLALIREVELCCYGESWVYARTVIPAGTLKGKGRFLHDELGERPLGELLFRDPNWRRSPFELSNLELADGTRQWQRRSIFYFMKKPLLLTETFLPPLISYCAQHDEKNS